MIFGGWLIGSKAGVLVSELGRLAVLNPHLHDGVPLAEAARRAGVPRRTATRWLAAYQANGLEGLRRLDRADRGGRRLPQEMIELIEGMALRRPVVGRGKWFCHTFRDAG